METAIRAWARSDLSLIGSSWIAAYKKMSPSGLPLARDAERELIAWLRRRFRDRSCFGYVAEMDDRVVGFVLGRVGELGFDPPILEIRRIGIIEVIYVAEDCRQQGLGTELATRAIDSALERGATAVETTFEAENPPAEAMWRKLGFRPYLHRARWTAG